MRKAACLLLLASLVITVITFWAWNHINHPMGNLLTGEPAGQLLAYGRLAGLLAAFAILVQIILAGRIKWVEKAFGLDRLLHLHHIIGFSFLVFLFAHPILVNMGHAMQADTSQWEQFIDFCRNWEGVLAATIGFIIMVAATGFSILYMKKWLKFETWYYTHLTLYIAIALAFGHQLEVGSDFTDNVWFARFWYALYIFTFGNLLFYRIIRPIYFFMRHRFYVAKVVAESENVTSIHIEGKKMNKFKARAGQFVIVRFWSKGFRWQAHPFSISCLPDGKAIRITIKQLGDFTNTIPNLQTGTPVYIDGPHGIFNAGRCGSSKVLMIAGGIGITPIRSVAEELIAEKHEVVILYANRDEKSIVFRKELDDLMASSSGKLQVFHILSNNPGWNGEKGHIDLEKIKRLVPDVLDRKVYLCGPPQMMKTVRKILVQFGLAKSNIFYERFSL